MILVRANAPAPMGLPADIQRKLVQLPAQRHVLRMLADLRHELRCIEEAIRRLEGIARKRDVKKAKVARAFGHHKTQNQPPIDRWCQVVDRW